MKLTEKELELVHEFPLGEHLVGLVEFRGVLFIATQTRIYRIVDATAPVQDVSFVEKI